MWKPNFRLTIARPGFAIVLVLALSLMVALAAAAAPGANYPEVIALPDGFEPEGIAVGQGKNFYAGSLATGAIYSGDLRTGAGDILVPPQEGRMSVGLSVDQRSNFLFVAGGAFGAGYVYDAGTGQAVADYQFAAPGTSFVNDVIVTREAAYFTDSFQPVLYRVPLGAGGELAGPFEELALSGDFAADFVPVPPGDFIVNANGIEATANGKALVIVSTAAQALYRVDPASGATVRIDLGQALPNGDGLLLDDDILYVVQNFLNQIAVVELNDDLTAGTVVDTLTSPEFKVPTTVAGFGDRLYAVNARFDVQSPMPDTAYQVVQAAKWGD